VQTDRSLENLAVLSAGCRIQSTARPRSAPHACDRFFCVVGRFAFPCTIALCCPRSASCPGIVRLFLAVRLSGRGGMPRLREVACSCGGCVGSGGVFPRRASHLGRARQTGSCSGRLARAYALARGIPPRPESLASMWLCVADADVLTGPRELADTRPPSRGSATRGPPTRGSLTSWRTRGLPTRGWAMGLAARQRARSGWCVAGSRRRHQLRADPCLAVHACASGL
jgi:hypothetical protein